MNPTQMCIFAGMLQLVPGTPSIEPPRVNPFSFLKRWRAGEKTTVTCMVASGTAPMKFIWMKDGKELTEASSVRFKHEQGYSMLFIEPVEVNSGGNYTCVVKNRAGIDSYTTFLDVEVPPKIVPFHFRKTIKPGENARTTCLVEAGDAPMTFSWLRNGMDATLTKNVHVNTQADFSILNVSPVDATSAGNFTCIVKNKAGFDSFTAYLDVEAPPEWKREPMDKAGVVGNTVRIECLGSGSPSPKMSWHVEREDGLRQAVSEAIPSRATVHANGTLVLHDLDTRDSGQYTCTADNGVAPVLKKTITLKINVTPKIIAFSFAGTAKPGNNVRTTCLLAEGDMPVTFTWLRNGVDASHSKNVHIVSHSDFSVLSINPVDAQSAGNYTCIAKNRAGFDSFAAYLDVEAPPTWLREPQDVGGTLGTKLVIKCAASGSPTPTIRWFKLEGGGSLLFTKSALPKNQNGSMVILSLETRDAGQYACEADNGITPTLRKTITVKVNVALLRNIRPTEQPRQNCHQRREATSDYGRLFAMHAPCYTTKICTQLNIIAASFFLFHAVSQSKEVPEIRPFSFSKNIPVGGKALVTCWITSGAQPVTFSWLKDGDSLSTVQGTRQKADPDYSVLLLEPVLPSHVGNYTCIAKNKFGFDSYTTVLEVESSPMWKKVSGDISVVMGRTLVMECLAAGFPHPSLTFRRTGDNHGNPVDFRTADERLTVHRNGTVTIKEVSTKDAGAYTCEAENGIPPNIQHTVKVVVHV
ncbi:hypothetical protein V5799_030684 [Amblyomma americanum]|uniref:Ig-like domain-containing protein n=1 Tax=Amblyomma americanum TaxID=6943 RepID=A0AAQ4EMN5_AMBAM